jgi:hypothetical protein
VLPPCTVSAAAPNGSMGRRPQWLRDTAEGRRQWRAGHSRISVDPVAHIDMGLSTHIEITLANDARNLSGRSSTWSDGKAAGAARTFSCS